jgi:hypothetical protein
MKILIALSIDTVPTFGYISLTLIIIANYVVMFFSGGVVFLISICAANSNDRLLYCRNYPGLRGILTLN